mmetsp:Transcript_2974/g.10863  ORF Transcript_2974/g.10863 Transcript_2974/m.10863 type:complete len:615 (+) Transcript_2974:86-1930(+)
MRSSGPPPPSDKVMAELEGKPLLQAAAGGDFFEANGAKRSLAALEQEAGSYGARDEDDAEAGFGGGGSAGKGALQHAKERMCAWALGREWRRKENEFSERCCAGRKRWWWYVGLASFGTLVVLVCVGLGVYFGKFQGHNCSWREGEGARWPVTLLDAERADDGLTLFSTVMCGNTWLVDRMGNVVHEWKHSVPSGKNTLLTEQGSLVRLPLNYAKLAANRHVFPNYDAAGGIEEVSWDGRTLFKCKYSDRHRTLHHDVLKLPNGNFLALVWRHMSEEECRGFGLDDSKPLGRFMLIDGEWGCIDDGVVEFFPEYHRVGTGQCKAVWEWWASEHTVQDVFPNLQNYGEVAAHPELIDINYVYMANSTFLNPQIMHFNSLDYNRDLDQIVLSSYTKSEMYIIDHSLSTEEAAGHTAGLHGHGGDFIWRFGNPRAYRRSRDTNNFGTYPTSDQEIFRCHGGNWIPKGYPGEGNLMVFNNGYRRKFDTPFSSPNLHSYSSADEIAPHLRSDGSYDVAPPDEFRAEGPDRVELVWSWHDPSLYVMRFGSAYRLPNGNTLFNYAAAKDVEKREWGLIEVTSDGVPVWNFTNPVQAHDAEVFRAYRYPRDYAPFRAFLPDL